MDGEEVAKSPVNPHRNKAVWMIESALLGDLNESSGLCILSRFYDEDYSSILPRTRNASWRGRS